jgi:hypothetical protein
MASLIEPLTGSSPFGEPYDTVVQIPDDYVDNLVRPTETASALVNMDLPHLLTDNDDMLPADSCVTDSTVYYTQDQLLRSPVPPRLWLGSVEIHLNHLIRSGAKPTSLQHPTVPGVYLPLWVISVWTVLLLALEQQQIWGQAQNWLETLVTRDIYSHMAEELMGRLAWGMSIQSIQPKPRIGLLAELLSSDWLKERHLNIFALYLRSRGGEYAGKVWFGDTHLATLISALPAASKIPAAKLGVDLIQYGSWITLGGYGRLLFPANINDNHWIVFSVDVEGKTFCLGAHPCLPRCA